MFNKTDVIRKLIPLCSRLCQIGYLKPGWIGAKIGLTILAKNEVKLYSDFVRSSPPAKNVEQVLIPGDKEISTNKDRFKNGLPVAPLVWENIKSTAEKLNVPELDRFEKAIK